MCKPGCPGPHATGGPVQTAVIGQIGEHPPGAVPIATAAAGMFSAGEVGGAAAKPCTPVPCGSVPIVAAGEIGEWPPALDMASCYCACCMAGGCHCLEYGPNQRCDCGPCARHLQQAAQQDHGDQAAPAECQRGCRDADDARARQDAAPQMVIPAPPGRLNSRVTEHRGHEIAQNPPICTHDGQGSGGA
jgi:hypothetical protein